MNIRYLFALAFAGIAAPAALAHTELAGTVPADEAVVESAPEQIELEFSAAVRLTALTVQKTGGEKRSLGPLPGEMTAAFNVALPALDDGHYVVSWRALSEDTHVMTGEFMFAIGEGASHEEHMSEETHASQDEAD